MSDRKIKNEFVGTICKVCNTPKYLKDGILQCACPVTETPIH